MHFKQRNRLISLLLIILAGIFTLFQHYFQDSKAVVPSSTYIEKTTIPKISAEKVSAQKVDIQQNTEVNNNISYDTVMSKDRFGQNVSAPIDYYGLVLSWSPGFCARQIERYGKNLPSSLKMQCLGKRHYGWIIHGLWAQNASAKRISQQPRFCKGDLPPVEVNILEQYLDTSPSLTLLQGEWEKHGACSFPDATRYFNKQQKLYRSFVLPQKEMGKSELLKWMKENNPQLKGKFIHLSRNELMICYSKKWEIISCLH